MWRENTLKASAAAVGVVLQTWAVRGTQQPPVPTRDLSATAVKREIFTVVMINTMLFELLLFGRKLPRLAKPHHWCVLSAVAISSPGPSQVWALWSGQAVSSSRAPSSVPTCTGAPQLHEGVLQECKQKWVITIFTIQIIACLVFSSKI